MTSVIKNDDLHVRQIKTGCLAQYTYVVQSQNDMAVIDPLRDIDVYKKMAAEANATIKWVILTHYHADYVSGFYDLAEQTNAVIIIGPDSNPSFNCKEVAHGEILAIGNHGLRVLHTPGHTFESSSFVLEDPKGAQLAVFTGDTLFLGDVGRPDLAQKADMTEKDLAKLLFQSLKLLKDLPDTCLILPGHGAGSACGKNISAGDFCTIGIQKTKNEAFKEVHEDKFVEMVTANLPPAPKYFTMDVHLNKAGKVASSKLDTFNPRNSRTFQETFDRRSSQRADEG